MFDELVKLSGIRQSKVIKYGTLGVHWGHIAYSQVNWLSCRFINHSVTL